MRRSKARLLLFPLYVRSWKRDCLYWHIHGEARDGAALYDWFCADGGMADWMSRPEGVG